MSCEGCVGAVKRVLGKMEGRTPLLRLSTYRDLDVGPALSENLCLCISPRDMSSSKFGYCCYIFCDKRSVVSGVESYEVDLKEQKVTVKGQVEPDAVLQTVSKTGKKTIFWDA
ncbi:hypothetical protein CXB51_001276 [Gossypium anomalum]|uniref:HMA domain-containing protein n=1 Tax=Gossypium anomalum TaxID=47600 RepID=A0A8J5ZLH7_9ROSI|nr:hypothetical protein CXB51_001276 [Gossypium anomalum]